MLRVFGMSVLAGLCALPASFALKGKDVAESKAVSAVVLVEAVLLKMRGRTVSSGCLLSPKVVLTAAHCVDDSEGFTVRAPYSKTPREIVKGTKVLIHPKFQVKEFENDIALVFLEKPIEIEGEYPTLYKGDPLRLETKLMIHGRVQNGELSFAKMFAASGEVTPYQGNLNIYGGFPQRVQPGDSGGPIFVDGHPSIIVAIVSGMMGFSRRNVETDAYLPISPDLRKWIVEQMKE